MMWIVGLLALAALALMLYARFAPIDVTDWHVAPEVTTEETMAGGYKTTLRLEGDADQITIQLVALATATPRTSVLAQDQGLITFITRSAGFGFPDFTTVAVRQDGLETEVQFYARLKIGKADLGVNKARVQAWIAQLTI